jgi:hypothetical protein
MSKDQRASVTAFDPLVGVTGRDGAIDYANKSGALERASVGNSDERFALALGRAVIDSWAQLPRDEQERIFECAVRMGHQTERDEMFREQLAKFLHDHHERTVSAGE